MINTPTTLVLGAGASMPYGLPSGAELRKSICLAADNQSPLVNKLETLFPAGVDASKVMDFARKFKLSNVASIDAFLAKNNGLTNVGKLCIAHELTLLENPSNVINDDIEDHWYQRLWQVLIDGADTVDDIPRNKISFVTFNYDRSLEYFLHTSIKHTYSVSDQKALETLQRMNILHVYGVLGEFHYTFSEGVRPYMPKMTVNHINTAANGIKVIPEARENNQAFIKAREWFGASETIGFLGFGFDPLNVERLDLFSVLEWHVRQGSQFPQIIISMHDKTQTEKQKVAEKLWPKNPGHIQMISGNNTMTIRTTRLLD